MTPGERRLGRLVGALTVLHVAQAALLVAALWVLVNGVWPPRDELRDQIGATLK